MEYTIRSEEAKDIDQIRAVLLLTFPTEAESNLVDALRASGKAVISLVAVRGEQVLGHILFSPVSTSPPDTRKGIGLAPLAVRLDMQLQGIGSQLIEAGLRLCRELGYDYCVVLGDPNYYHRFGFETASRSGLENEYGVDEEFMVIYCTTEKARGLVKYGPEFAMFAL